jgi:hypothetical protein
MPADDRHQANEKHRFGQPFNHPLAKSGPVSEIVDRDIWLFLTELFDGLGRRLG